MKIAATVIIEALLLHASQARLNEKEEALFTRVLTFTNQCNTVAVEKGECDYCCDEQNNKAELGSITFRYEPVNKKYSLYQGNKASCNDLSKMYPNPAKITVSTHKNMQTFPHVQEGDEFTVYGPFSDDILFIFEAVNRRDLTWNRRLTGTKPKPRPGRKTSCTIHTSCSVPIVADDQIGPIVIVDDDRCDECCEVIADTTQVNGSVTVTFKNFCDENRNRMDYIGFVPCEHETSYYTTMFAWACYADAGDEDCQTVDEVVTPSSGTFTLAKKNLPWYTDTATHHWPNPGCYRLVYGNDGPESQWPHTVYCVDERTIDFKYEF